MKTPEQSQIWIHYKTWFQTMVAFRVFTPYGAYSIFHLHQIHSPCRRRGYVRAWRRNKIHQTVWKATTHRIRRLFQYFILQCSSHFQGKPNVCWNVENIQHTTRLDKENRGYIDMFYQRRIFFFPYKWVANLETRILVFIAEKWLQTSGLVCFNSECGKQS